VLAAKILYPEAVAVLPKSLNPNVKAFLSIHKDLQECIRSPAMMVQTEVSLAGHSVKNHANVC
jgi:hypothetical protein